MFENSVEYPYEKFEALSLKIPFNCQPLAHQVAGHFYGTGKTKLGLLQSNDGLVLKPVQATLFGAFEHKFFKNLFTSDEFKLNQDEIQLKNLLPTYRGSFVYNDIEYIKLDDLAYGIINPVITDIKIGRRTYDPEASVQKINKHKQRYPPAELVGFQLLGLRVFNENDCSFVHYDKVFGRSLKQQDIIHGLALYYQFHQQPQITAIRKTIDLLEQILAWFQKQTTYHFFSSSLIVVYEGNLERMLLNEIAPSHDSYEKNVNNLVRIKMVDFAHVFPADNQLDENYLFGLVNLIEHLKQLLSPNYIFKDLRV